MGKLLIAAFVAFALYAWSSEEFQFKLKRVQYELNYDIQVIKAFGQ